jgi:serine phosphatase RsbU (regulator of sigma subunit)
MPLAEDTTLFLSGTVAGTFTVWPIDAGVITVGRSSANTVSLPDGTVSKEHAEIMVRDGQCTVRDLGSRNGTRVNGVDARTPVPLRAGDRLEVGHVRLTVSATPPAGSIPFGTSASIESSIRIGVDEVLSQRASNARSSAQIIRLLVEAGRLLVLPRPLRETCEELLDFVAEALPASRYVVLLGDDPAADPVQMAARTVQGRATQPLALSRSIIRAVLEDRASVLTQDASLDPRFAGHQSVVQQAVHSAMAVPLFDNERVLGIFYVDSQDIRVTFTQDQLELLTLLANMAAVKITNARLLEAEQVRLRLAQEAATAAHIQRSLLPAGLPSVDGYEFDAYLSTCYEVGGDLYDLHVTPEGRVLFLLGDVSGKGMGASLLMSSFLSVARVLYDTCTSVAELATRLGAITHRSTGPTHFITGIVGSLDPATGTVRYVNAGHPSGVVVARDGRLCDLPSGGIPFGVLPEFAYDEAMIQIEPDATLTIFSDGVTEAQRGDEFFGEERVNGALRACVASESLALARVRLLNAVRDFEGDTPRADDLTVLLIRRLHGGEAQAAR